MTRPHYRMRFSPSAPLPGYAAIRSPVLPSNAAIVEYGPHVGRPSNGAIDYTRAIERHERKCFSKFCLRNVVRGAARMKHGAGNFVGKGLAGLRFELVHLERSEPTPQFINRRFRHAHAPLARNSTRQSYTKCSLSC